MIKVKTIGGYSEVGKNATIVEIENKVIILDLGIHLENYINFTQDEDVTNYSISDLMKVGAIPDVSELKDKEIIAIAPSHAHLDHLGAIQFLAQRFECPVIGTPYTTEVIRTILKEEKLNLPNNIITVAKNSKFLLDKDLEIYLEFIEVTHSTPDAAILAVHSKYGTILYANDFKLDNTPTFGNTSNIKRLEELTNVKALIMESLYAKTPGRCPSETQAKEELKSQLDNLNNSKGTIVMTTFSSHISRLRTILELSRKTKRKIAFLGRSLSKYTEAAENIGYINRSGIEIAKYGKEIKRKLSHIAKHKNEFIIVCTGHQGEPNSVLGKIANQRFNFMFDKFDTIIFSCTVIPTESNILNRQQLEYDLEAQGVEIIKDVHVSGHAYAEDLKELIQIINPEIVIPSHGTIDMQEALADLAEEIGYKKGESIFVLANNKEIILK